MESVNTMRGILVGGAVLTAIVAGVLGFWVVTAIMAFGVAGHAGLWWWLKQRRGAQPAPDPR